MIGINLVQRKIDIKATAAYSAGLGAMIVSFFIRNRVKFVY